MQHTSSNQAPTSAAAAPARSARSPLAQRQALFALTLLFLFPQLGHAQRDPDLREDEVYCEEAGALLDQCCGGSPKTLLCNYRPPSECSCDECLYPATYPSLTQTQYVCLEQLSCETIVERGYCADFLAGTRLGYICSEPE